ncbi:kinase-like domain-containing protein [Xylariaceae sp. FL0662B]|nr:kinase-like domain-containing protein [Xylariaceae sp. FL0662B]
MSSPSDKVHDAQAIKSCFSNDPRFKYCDLVGAGGFGSAHHVQYIGNGESNVTDFLVKRAYRTGQAEEALVDEWAYLQRLRGGEHTVQLVNMPNDPLQENHFDGEWIILEWLPNGTLDDFLAKASAHGVKRLPNRLLWRFLLCLVRGCCGMAWPRRRRDDLLEVEIPIPGVPPEALAHNDLHTGNVLLGDFSVGGEHAITPILKMIDFGLAGDDKVDLARASNLREVGELMTALITLEGDSEIESTTVNYLGIDIKTWASAILPPDLDEPRYPWLDEWLTTIVALCMAWDNRQKPTLQALSNWVPYAVVERDARFYGVPEESNNSIRALCEQIILSAPTSP